MCVIIANKTDKPVDVKYLKEGARANPDGMGLAFAKDGRVWLCKSLNNFEAYFEKYNLPNAVWHFRIATHGSVKKNNCHPFVVLSKEDGDPIDLVMFHNGVLSFTDTMRNGKKDDRTDSEILASEYIAPLLKNEPNLLKKAFFQSMLGELCGSSKLTFLDSDGNITIINKDKGVVRDNIWFSNSSAFPVQFNTSYYNCGNYNYFKESEAGFTSLEDFYTKRYAVEDYVNYVKDFEKKEGNVCFLYDKTKNKDKKNPILAKGPSYDGKDASVWDSDLMASTVKTKNAEYVYFHSNWYELDRYILENLYK